MKRKILITSILLIVLIILSGILINAVKPKYHNVPEKGTSYIEYNGKKYYPIGQSYDFVTDKTLTHRAMYSICSLKGDKENNFLYFSEWQGRGMYTCLKDYTANYPYGEYKEERVTGIKIGDFLSEDKELNNILLHPETYSDMTEITYPWKEAREYLMYVYEDNLPLSGCHYGWLAYYDDKWIFTKWGTEMQGDSNKYGDTRKMSGIIITDQEAIRILDTIK